MEEALRAILLAAHPVTALTGPRVTWGERARGAGLPAIVMHLIDGVPDYAMSGPGGYRVSRVQVNCLADDYSQAKRLGRAVELAVSGLKTTAGGIDFQSVFVDIIRDIEEAGNGAEELLSGVSIDVIISHSATE